MLKWGAEKVLRKFQCETLVLAMLKGKQKVSKRE